MDTKGIDGQIQRPSHTDYTENEKALNNIIISLIVKMLLLSYSTIDYGYLGVSKQHSAAEHGPLRVQFVRPVLVTLDWVITASVCVHAYGAM